MCELYNENYQYDLKGAIMTRFFALCTLLFAAACQSETNLSSVSADDTLPSVERVCGSSVFPDGANVMRTPREYLLGQEGPSNTFIGITQRDVWIREPNFDREYCLSKVSIRGDGSSGGALPVLTGREITTRDRNLRQQKIDECERLSQFTQRRRYGSHDILYHPSGIAIETGIFVGCEILIDSYSIVARISWGDTEVDLLSVFGETFVFQEATR